MVVCVKQVPDASEVRVDPATNNLIREGVPSIMNPYDRHAIEAAIRLREAVGGHITALSMGPPQAEEVLREAIALGVDEAVLVCDRAFAGSDTLATSYTLALAIKKLGPVDLVLCGQQSIDGETAQVGPELAEHLGFAQCSYVRALGKLAEGALEVERAAEDGYERVRLLLPAVLTVMKELNEPRLPSLKGMLRAKKAELRIWTAADLEADPSRIGQSGSPTRVVGVFAPQQEKKAQLLTGSLTEQIETLVERLQAEKII